MSVLTNPICFSLLRALNEYSALTADELARCCHISDRAVRRQLRTLSASGLVREHPGERDGLTPGRPASRFALDPGVRRELASLFDLLSEPLEPGPR